MTDTTGEVPDGLSVMQMNTGATMLQDKNNHNYVEVDNIRLTLVPKADRPEAKNWSGQDVLRIQAYQGSDKGAALHMGAEFPIADGDALLRLIAAMCEICSTRAKGG